MINVLLLGASMARHECGERWKRRWNWVVRNVGSIRYLLNVNNLEQRPAAKPVDIGVLSVMTGRSRVWTT